MNDHGAVLATLSVGETGHGLYLYDADGNRRAWLQMLKDEGSRVGVGNASEPFWNTPEAK